MGVFVDITGQKYGKLTAIQNVGKDVRNGRVWECVCDCGKHINVSSNQLRRNHTRSCGCLKMEALLARSTTHGQGSKTTRTAEYRIWAAIKTRCTNSKVQYFEHYGGRGIKMCDRWCNSFENFLEDMGKRPSNEHSIDRKDVNGDYIPENCKWSTGTEQARNQRIRKDNESGVRGVAWNKRDKTWYVTISVDNKSKHVGCYKEKNEAIESRKQAEIKYWNKIPS